MISITVQDRNGNPELIEIPEGISLSLMEVLKGSGYDILAVCGGMAICATCHIQVIKGSEALPPPEDSEVNMLDTLPDALPGSRLACQIRINRCLNGSVIRIIGKI